MANISLSFTFRQERFSLRATVKGTSKRNYKEVQNLISPNLDSWDKKAQRFNEPTNEAIHNNNVLRVMKERYQHLIDTFNPHTGKELFELHETASKVEAKKELTFGDYVQQLINSMRNESNKRPSKNYQCYITLFNKLKKEGQIINIPLSKIGNSHFIKFSDWVLNASSNGKTNYVNAMKQFKSVHSKAFERELNDNLLRFKYMNHAPVREEKKRKALDSEQYRKFVDIDLSQVSFGVKNKEYYKELYHNFCIFLYEMKMRPVDVIRLHTDNIVTIKGKKYLSYVPEKKKNYLKDNKVKNEITPKAKSIIAKYKGESSKGYIFPFPMNEYDWDMGNAASWNKWNNRKQATMERARAFVKACASYIGIDPNDLILYTFRHSVITHEVNNNKKPLMTIAKEAGTSAEMIDKHYYSLLT
jgi:hypothetical protein